MPARWICTCACLTTSNVGVGDNPTVGLILCAEKDEIVARYSILHESQQMFASKYMLYLPTEEELQKELARERDQIQSKTTKTSTSRTTKKRNSPKK